MERKLNQKKFILVGVKSVMRKVFHKLEKKSNKMITIGIPTYNGEGTIKKCINSVLPQISKDDEIIIVASGCTDNTVKVVKEMMNKEKRIKLMTEPERRGKSSAINLIIQNAKSDIIVQTDDDVILEIGAISFLLPLFEDESIGAVSGNPIPIIPKENLFYYWTIMSYRKIGEIREKEVKNKTFNVHLSGYLLAFRKKALKNVPFAKGAVDALMGKIIKEKGYKLTYESNAKVYVRCPTTIKDFLIQKARVRAGYAYLQNAPRTMKKEIFYLPKELFRIPLCGWPKFIFSGIIYTYSWIKGKYMAKTNKSLEEIWKTAKTTKN